jgi:hypothetical protein
MKYEFLVNFTSRSNVDSILCSRNFWINNPAPKDPFEKENYEFCPKNISEENKKRVVTFFEKARFWACFVKIDICANCYNKAKELLKNNIHLFVVYNNLVTDKSLSFNVEGFLIFDKDSFDYDLATAVNFQLQGFKICRNHMNYKDVLYKSKVKIFIINNLLIADFSKSNLHNFLKHKNDPFDNEFYFGEDEFRYLITTNEISECFLPEKLIVKLSEKTIVDVGTYESKAFIKTNIDDFTIADFENWNESLINNDPILICNPETLQKLKDKGALI